MPPPSPTSTRICSAKAPTPARASTTSMLSRPRSPAGCRNSTLLSHDLFEGVFARAGLASDIEVVEEFPARYDVAALRQHRWARGDWQLLPWILGRGPRAERRGARAMPAIGRWKMLDNLRRTLSAPAAIARPAGRMGVAASTRALVWTVFILATIVLPTLIPVSRAIAAARAGITMRSHLGPWQRSSPRLDPVRSAGHVSRAPGVADGRRDRANPGPAVRHAGDICSNGFRRRRRRSARGSICSASIAGWPAQSSSAFWRWSSRCAVGAAGTWLLAAPFAALWIASPAIARWVEPVAPVGGPAAVSARRCPRPAADRAPNVAVLRDFRDAGRPHAAAGQFPGRPGAGARPPDVADQSRPLSPVGGRAPATSAGSGRSRPSSGWRRRSRPWAGWRASVGISTTGTTRRICGRSIRNTSPRSTAAIWPGI